jgi:hypothetical protein
MPSGSKVAQWTAYSTKGALMASALRAVERVLSEVGVADAKIIITRAGTVRFSSAIPASVHQRLRNIVLNA